MNNQDFNQIQTSIRKNIQNYVHPGITGFNNDIKQEANRFVDAIKPEISPLFDKLKSRSIACNAIEDFLLSKRDSINLSFLSEKGINPDDIEEVRNDILRLIASAVLNSYLDALFKNQKRAITAAANLFLN